MTAKRRNRLLYVRWDLCILDQENDFSCTSSFDCGDDDLNDFFRNDALKHKKQLLAETYVLNFIKAPGKKIPVAFISFLNDSIRLEEETDSKKKKKTNFFRYLRRHIPLPKRNYSSYPAVKIGRLGVETPYQGNSIGTLVLNMSKKLFLTQNRTGCRFVTVDAYNTPRVIEFYRDNGFDFLSDEDEKRDSRTMFFDLIILKDES